MNLDNSVGNNKRALFLNQGRVTVEVHTQPKKALSNSKRKNATRNHPLIHATIIISVTNVMNGNQICASYVDWRIISLRIDQNPTPWIRNFVGTQKILKIVHTDQRK